MNSKQILNSAATTRCDHAPLCRRAGNPKERVSSCARLSSRHSKIPIHRRRDDRGSIPIRSRARYWKIVSQLFKMDPAMVSQLKKSEVTRTEWRLSRTEEKFPWLSIGTTRS